MDALPLAYPAASGGPPDSFVAAMLAERDAFERALMSGAIVPHYQPILDLRSGVVVAVEALARWWHPTRGILGPTDFLSLASAAGLAVPLGERILVRAVRDLAYWPNSPWRDRPVDLHVNLAAEELADPILPQRVRRICGTVGFDLTRLVLEVPEALITSSGTTAILRSLRSLGARIALEDFGGGSASLAKLRALPLDILKIDRSLLASLGRERHDDILVAGMMGVAKALGLEVIAVGVEDAAQRNLLLHGGCRLGQGFLFSRPVSPELCLRYMMAAPITAVGVPRRWQVT